MANTTVGLIFQSRKTGSGARQAEREVDQFGRTSERAGRQAQGFNKTAASMKSTFTALAGIAGVAVATQAIVSFGKAVITAGSDAQENMAKFSTVFENAEGGAGRVSAAFDDLADKLGRNSFELKTAGAAFGDLFQPLGFSADRAADLSLEMTELATDLSSFNNMPMDEALRRLQGTLIGSHENALAFGVVINENVLKQEMARIGADKLTGAQLEQAKVQARLNLLMQGTTAAQGDVVRTSDSLANQVRSLRGAWDETVATIGMELVPLLTQELVPVFDAIKDDTLPVLIDLAREFGPDMADSLGKVASGLTTVLEQTDKWVERVRIAHRVSRAFSSFGLTELARATKAAGLSMDDLNPIVQAQARHVANEAEELEILNSRLDWLAGRGGAGRGGGATGATVAVVELGSALGQVDEPIVRASRSLEAINSQLRGHAAASAEAVGFVGDMREGWVSWIEPTEKAVEIVDELFEGFRKLNPELSGVFLDGLESANRQTGEYTDSTTSLSQAIEDTDRFILDLAASSGATTAELEFLTLATGDFTEAQIEAAVKAIEFETRLAAIRKKFEEGEISVYQMRDAITKLISEIQRIPSKKTVRIVTKFETVGSPPGGFPGEGSGPMLDSGTGQVAMQVPGRAAGGPVASGRSYIVGESGPELFIPRVAGTVFNRSQAGGFGGVQIGDINIYLSNPVGASPRTIANMTAEAIGERLGRG